MISLDTTSLITDTVGETFTPVLKMVRDNSAIVAKGFVAVWDEDEFDDDATKRTKKAVSFVRSIHPWITSARVDDINTCDHRMVTVVADGKDKKRDYYHNLVFFTALREFARRTDCLVKVVFKDGAPDVLVVVDQAPSRADIEMILDPPRALTNHPTFYAVQTDSTIIMDTPPKDESGMARLRHAIEQAARESDRVISVSFASSDAIVGPVHVSSCIVASDGKKTVDLATHLREIAV